MNKKILVSLVFALVGVVACNGGGGGGASTPLGAGNYVLSSWDVPSNAVCPQQAPEGTIGRQGVVGSNGMLCGTGDSAGFCYSTNTSASTNCISGTYTGQIDGLTVTQTTSSNSCGYVAATNSLYGIITATQTSQGPTENAIPSCFSIVPGTVSTNGIGESIQTKKNVDNKSRLAKFFN